MVHKLGLNMLQELAETAAIYMRMRPISSWSLVWKREKERGCAAARLNGTPALDAMTEALRTMNPQILDNVTATIYRITGKQVLFEPTGFDQGHVAFGFIHPGDMVFTAGHEFPLEKSNRTLFLEPTQSFGFTCGNKKQPLYVIVFIRKLQSSGS